MGASKNPHRGLVERDHLEDLVVVGRIILKPIFKRWGREA
jgi:hypothetical protein